MKIRCLVLIYTAIMAIIMLFSLRAIGRNEAETADIVTANSRYQQVRQALTPEAVNDGSKAKIEADYHCRIILRTDRNYESAWVEAFNRGDLIFDYLDDEKLVGKIIFAGAGGKYDDLRAALLNRMMVTTVSLLVGGYLLIFLLYYHIMRPFGHLQAFAREVSRGNLDLPLKNTRENYFGAFTESFDLMRVELKRARENEYRANISKKELVAGLSHDIKTPVATIKAACEILQVKEGNPETLEKVKIIAGKAEIIDRLIGNMFQATLEELEVLAVRSEAVASRLVMDMLTELAVYGPLRTVNAIPSCLISADPMRLNQVIDNIISNSYKYAQTEVTVAFADHEDGITVRISDQGPGVPGEELALLTGKFYRGSNAEGKEGTGLGLYLADYFMRQMGGRMECYCDEGFVVELFLRKD